MSLIDLLLRSTLGNYRAPDILEFALFNGRKEIVDVAYRRAEVRKGQWTIRNDGTAEITVRFGPFVEPSSFDHIALMRSGEIIELRPFTAPTHAPKHTVYEHTYIEEFVKDNG